MTELARQLVLGAASIFLAPAGLLPGPKYRITVPESTATEALAGDFGRISADFCQATNKVEKTVQLELSI